MKKVTLLIAMAALVLFASCKKENGTKGVILKASIEQNNNGRTSLNPADGAINWTSGDKILVNNGSSSVIFNLMAGSNTTNGTFTYNGEYTFGDNNVAVYPEAATIRDNTVSLTLPEEQTFTAEGTFGNGANPMLGSFTNTEDLTLTSLCGGLGISLMGDNIDITAIEVVSKKTEALNGAFEADCAATNPTLAPAMGNAGNNKVRLNCTTTLTATAQSFYFVLPVGTLAEGFTLNVYNGGEELIFTKSTENTELAVVLNTVKTMNTVEVTTIPTHPAVPEGAVNGLFTINENGDQVYFSQGNLQYIGSATPAYWKFAENQWDYLGEAQNEDFQTIDRDLFGWGTSGWNNGNRYYQPYDTPGFWWASETGYGYGPTDGTNYNYDLTGDYANADWGVYNAISNGGSTPNQWRTLTYSEWSYVINDRSTSSGIRYAKAVVNGVNGFILLPDDWSASVYALNYTNRSDAPYTTNVISEGSWATMESAGAVFLPAAGRRGGTLVLDVGYYGYYWSSSPNPGNPSTARYFYFHSGYTGVDYSYRYYGFSVRLVREN